MDFIFRNFTDVKEDDVILSDFSVALQRDAVIHGRIYISLNGYYFHSNILGFVTAVSNRWTCVNEIKKDKVALFLPIIIHIYSNDDKHTFSFLQNRDRAYEIIKLVWLNTRAQNPLPAQAIIDRATEIYYQSIVDVTAENNHGNDSLTTMPVEISNSGSATPNQYDENDSAQRDKDSSKRESKNNTSNSDASSESLKTASSDSLNNDKIENNKNDIKNNDQKIDIKNTPKRNTLHKTKMENDKVQSKSLNQITELTQQNYCECADDDFKLVIEKKLQTDINSLLKLFFEQTSPIIPLLSTALGLSEYKITESTSDPEKRWRTISYIYPMSFPFSSVLTETSVDLGHYSDENLHHFVSTSSVSQNAPYCDTFKVLMHYCFTTNPSKPSSVSLKIYFKIEFIKKISTFIKSMILGRSQTKTEEFVNAQVKFIEEYLTSIPSLNKEILLGEVIPTSSPIISQTANTSNCMKLINTLKTLMNFTARVLGFLDNGFGKSVIFSVVLAYFLHIQLRILNILGESIEQQRKLLEALNEFVKNSSNIR